MQAIIACCSATFQDLLDMRCWFSMVILLSSKQPRNDEISSYSIIDSSTPTPKCMQHKMQPVSLVEIQNLQAEWATKDTKLHEELCRKATSHVGGIANDVSTFQQANTLTPWAHDNTFGPAMCNPYQKWESGTLKRHCICSEECATSLHRYYSTQTLIPSHPSVLLLRLVITNHSQIRDSLNSTNVDWIWV